MAETNDGNGDLSHRLAGLLVHVFTGLGAVCALLAVQAVMSRRWAEVFIWLGIAFLIDGIDGPIARAVEVKRHLARFSGEHIDLVIDYLTYVFVPVLALLVAGRLPEMLAFPLATIILLSSLFHFSDQESKASDLAFVGFPAIWNIVAFYVFALDLGAVTTSVLIVIATVATFIPLHWVHPLRVRALRAPTMALTVVWAAVALQTVLSGFPAPALAQSILVAVALYGLGVSAWLSWIGSGQHDG